MDSILAAKFQSYPEDVREKLLNLRQLILDTAAEYPEVETLTETLKWGEPAYISKIGSTVRMDWKAQKPEQLALYFNCNTKLVATFRELYGASVDFEGNRALVLPRSGEFPHKIIKHCIAMALQYHKIKHKPLLGA